MTFPATPSLHARSPRRSPRRAAAVTLAGLLAAGALGVPSAAQAAPDRTAARTPAARATACPVVVAHRGLTTGTTGPIENTYGAFDRSTALARTSGSGAGVTIELDVWASRGASGRRVLSVIHDRRVRRTFDAPRNVAVPLTTWSYLSRLRTYDKQVMPRLDSVVKRVGATSAGLQVELKDPRITVAELRTVIRLARSNGLAGRVAIISFDQALVSRAATARTQERAGSAVRLGLLSTDGAVDPATVRTTVGAGGSLLVRHPDVTADLVQRTHRAGLTIGAWTVNDPADRERLRGLGVDSLTTDMATTAVGECSPA